MLSLPFMGRGLSPTGRSRVGAARLSTRRGQVRVETKIATPSPPGLRFASTTLPMKGREKVANFSPTCGWSGFGLAALFFTCPRDRARPR